MLWQEELGQWNFKSSGNGVYYEGHMFPLCVEKQLDFWPEKDIRQRVWVSLNSQLTLPYNFAPAFGL